MKAKEIGQPLFTFKCFFPWLLDIEGKRREILERKTLLHWPYILSSFPVAF